MLFRGMLVSLPEGRGVGKLEDVVGDVCSVAIFRSIIRSETVQIPVSDLTRAYLSPQTRVYVLNDERLRVGRVADFLAGDNGLVDYEVRFPNGKRADYSELKLFLRPWSAPDDPAEVLANGGAESQFLHDRRQAAILPLLRLRGATQGMTALVSAGIDLAPHQVAAVRRVLTDPVQRYLLADEVGLGKTIEAGLIARQHLIDDPETGILIAVPAHLVAQWRVELQTKLRLDQFDGMVEVVTHADLDRVRHVPDILIIDEAHHLVGVEVGPLAPAAVRLRDLANKAPVLLLLSATPALGDEARFLALLNLLDPSSHPHNDLQGFRRKLEGRREIGRLLLALDPEAPKLALRQRASEMENLFPNDPVVAALAPKLIAATREAPDELPSLCAALKGHIADTYRIHQRLIRSRRADAQGWEFTPRGQYDKGEPSFAHVRVEADATGWVVPLLPTLEEWRFGALDGAAGRDEALDAASRRYASLLSAMAEGRASLLAWIAEDGFEGSFVDEPDILARLARLAAEGEEDGFYATACESTRRLVRSLRSESGTAKIVAFSSSAAGASAFGAALSASLEDCEVLLLTADQAAPNEAILASFAAQRKPTVLVCDRSAEEGLNLAFADAIFHLDLPLSAARIEQRIGRLDRFGRRNGVVRHRVVLPADEDDSPWTGWADFLCHGLGIYHRSISDVQFLLDDIERRLFRILLEEGPAGVEALSTEIRTTIGDERRSQDEQYALDRIAIDEEPVETFIEALEAAEEDEAQLEEGVDRWLLGALQLKKRPIAMPERDPFKLAAGKDTLIPRRPWLEAFNLEERPLTWRRRIATSHPDAMLLRPGAPLIDMIERFTRWDDRGTAFITWRTAPNWTDDPWIGFRLCFVVEPDIPVADLFAPSRTELVAIRRAQRYLPPRTLVVHVDGDGEAVEDQTLLSILERPYRNAEESEDGGGDVNLSSRPQVLAGLIDPSAFAALCRSVRDRTLETLIAEPTLQAAVAAGVRLAGADIERRRSRLRQRHATGDAGASIDLELLEELLPGLSRPAIRLDAMGCFIVSRHAPRVPLDA